MKVHSTNRNGVRRRRQSALLASRLSDDRESTAWLVAGVLKLSAGATKLCLNPCDESTSPVWRRKAQLSHVISRTYHVSRGATLVFYSEAPRNQGSSRNPRLRPITADSTALPYAGVAQIINHQQEERAAADHQSCITTSVVSPRADGDHSHGEVHRLLMMIRGKRRSRCSTHGVTSEAGYVSVSQREVLESTAVQYCRSDM